MSSRGRRASAWAISSRCCSPPESWPIGRWAYPPAPTRSTSSRTRAAAARERGPGSGRPHRSPSSPRRTTSRPRIRRDASKLRRCGRYPTSWLACPGGRPSSRTVPRASGTRPRTALSSVDFPTPLGPRMATNSPGAIVAPTPDQTVRPPSTTVASTISTRAGRAVGSSGTRAPVTRVAALWRGAVDMWLPYGRLGQRPFQRGELGHLPVLERGAGRGQRLGDRGDRDPGLPGLVDLRLHVGRGVLAVVDVHPDLSGPDLGVDGGLVRGGRVGALADRGEERRGGQQGEPERRGEHREDRLRGPDRGTRVRRPDPVDRVGVPLEVGPQHRVVLVVEG